MASTHHVDYRLLIEMLRETREGEDVAQTELAQTLGTTQTFVSKVERGERRLDPVELTEFLEALGVQPEAWLKKYLASRRELHRKQEIRRKVSSP